MFHALWKSIFFRPSLQLLILYTLGCLVEGRPRTLKKCGRKDIHSGKIVGGNYVQPGEYPWMVSLNEKINYRFKHICGGTIINEHYVITAAHCIYYPHKPWLYEIYTGLHQLSRKSHRPAKKYKIYQVIVHENYDGGHNDIALLRTKEPIQIEGTSGRVNGICLPQDNEDPTGWALVTGWGRTKYGGEISDTLQAVKVPLVSRKLCYTAYDEDQDNDNDDVVDTQICSGVINRDSCQGDSGGPLIQKNKKGVYVLIGVVSYGIGCGLQHYPGVYTKVASYMDWLEENMV